MEDKAKIETMRSLKWFLLGRFLLTVLCIYAAEQMLGLFYDYGLFPAITNFLARQKIYITAARDTGNITIQALFYVIASFLPDGIANLLRQSAERGLGSSFRIMVASSAYEGGWGIAVRFVLILVFLLIVFASVLPYLAGALYYCRGVAGKVNELMEEEKERQLAYDRERNLLLSDIAHDIRTPLTTLCSYSKALTDGVADAAKQREYLQIIYRKSMQMNELLTLLFEYVKMGSDGFTLHIRTEDLGDMLRESVASLYADFERAGIALRVEIPETPAPCDMDKLQMTRAVTNLLTNAVRYGGAGGHVLVGLADDTITVADDGLQIDEELAGRIFEPFTRGDKARSTDGGSGLGLSIAHRIVALHGGELKLNRAYGHGYTKAFQIVLEKTD